MRVLYSGLLFLSYALGKLNKCTHLVIWAVLCFFMIGSSCNTEKNPNNKKASFFVSHPLKVEKQDVITLPVGSKAPDFYLPATDGRYYSLADFNNSKVLVVVFTCNHCPTAQAYESRLKDIANDYDVQDVQIIAISPNSPLGLLYEELGYSDLGDDFEEMIIRAEDHEFNFPYLYDGDTQETSLKYGPVATPHVFVFNEKRILKYTGRIDASEKPGSARGEDLRQAIDAIILDIDPPLASTKTFGCSTKWGWKLELKKKVNEEWEKKEVSLQPINVDGIKKIISNDGNEKLLLINVWATWCGPCALEFPEFIVLQRMYGARDFEFISISTDLPQKKKNVLNFLRKVKAPVPNYQFGSENKYALIEAVDSSWNGALPYSLLIGPDGNKIWAHQGTVDFLALKRAIVENPLMGRYY